MSVNLLRDIWSLGAVPITPGGPSAYPGQRIGLPSGGSWSGWNQMYASVSGTMVAIIVGGYTDGISCEVEIGFGASGSEAPKLAVAFPAGWAYNTVYRPFNLHIPVKLPIPPNTRVSYRARHTGSFADLGITLVIVP